MDTPSFYHLLDEHCNSIKQPFTSPIFSRDFAYADNGPVILQESTRMAEGNIIDFNASDFAEYVHQFPILNHVALPRHTHAIASLGIRTVETGRS